MTNSNPWSNPSQTSLEDIQRMAEHLEERGKRPDQVQVNRAVRQALAPQPGERLLEVGSGTGILCRLAASDIVPGGTIIGMDISPHFNAIAWGLASEAGLSKRTRYLTAPAETLPFDDDCFDGAWAARLLLHASDPVVVVREMVRVVRPGKRLVLMDWDWETLTVDHPDRDLTRRLLHWRCDHHSGNNWSGRQLVALARGAGFQDLQVTPVTVTAFDERPALTLSLWRAAEVALTAGAITVEEHDAWVGGLKTRIAAGQFFASLTYFIVKGWK